MYQMEKNTAEIPVVTPEAKTWRSRVSATIWRVRSRFGSLCLAVPLTSLTDNDRPGWAGLGIPEYGRHAFVEAR
jgi:hypothetical protein